MSLPADLSRPIRATARRIRLQRALNAGTLFALAGLGLAALVVALVKTDALGEAGALPWLYGAGALPILGALFGALRPVHRLTPAKLLDRAHRLHDRVSNALEFAEASERSAFMDAAIDDARRHAPKLEPARAMPLKLPIELVGVVGLGAGVALLALLEVPRVIEERIVTGGIDPVRLHADDLEGYESELRNLLDDPDTSDDVRDAAREFNRLVEDLADERLDRAESLRRISELEARLRDTRPADAELMRESLEQLGQDMDRSSLAEELSEALSEADAERAESAMRQLAERLRSDDPPSRAEIERLRQALARAGREQEDCRAEIAALEREVGELRGQEEPDRAAQRRIGQIESRLGELRAECDAHAREQEIERQRSLLQREREQAQTEQQRRLLQRRERQLDRLRRQHEQAMEQRRRLDRLQREMRESAESLNQRQQEQAANDLEQGAESLNRMAREQMSEDEMQRMQQQLAQLRELLRRQRQQQANGQGQQGQQQQGQGGGQGRMDRFVLRARGEGNTRVQMGGQGQQGQGGQQQGQGQDGQQGQQGQQGQGGQAGGGQGGQQPGQGGEQQQVLQLGGEGEGNAILEIPGMGEGQQGGQGGGTAQMGPGAGTGHDPTMLDDPTRLGGTRRNVRVEGEHGEGPSRSEVIQGSAQRGFANREYRDVYTDYSGHAEEVLERDEVPPGYRFYVRRYFQLIRPRQSE